MRLLLIPAVLTVSGCALVGYPGGTPGASSAPAPAVDGSARRADPGATLTDAQVNAIPDAVPAAEPPSKYGNPPQYRVDGHTYHVLDHPHGYEAEGIASWYGSDFQGKRTSSGEPYDMYLMTAAHRTLPIPTYIEVTNLENGRTVVVRVNDRGPFHSERIVDLSYVAARKLGIVGPGTARVRIRALEPGG